MQFLFIGLGSIAMRHIRNLRDMTGDSITITVLRSGKGRIDIPDQDKLIDFICYDMEYLGKWYDAIFITNPTALHYRTLCEFKEMSNCFFIEKPVFETGKEDITDFLGDGKQYYVACPLRYTYLIQYLKQRIDFSKIYSVRCISSSYLPEWRPDTDYRKSYSAKKELGGGVSIDLIHEWDYIYYLLGRPESVKSIVEKKSRLEIDSDDIAVYIAEYTDKIVEIHLDYFGREPVRKVELFGENDTLVADLVSNQITWLKKKERISFVQERDDYQKKELQHFLDVLAGTAESGNGLEEAGEVLRIAKGDKNL